MTDWYKLDVPEVLKQLDCDLNRGLSTEEAARRRKEHGPNQLEERSARGAWSIVIEQFTGTLVVMLIIAAVVSLFLGEYIDAGAILTIVVLNAILGFVQDFRAEKAMAALQRMAVPTVRVRRDGSIDELSAHELVPGDLVYVEAGTSIPADGRIVDSANLKAEEAALTGESEPVEKQTDTLEADDPALGDQQNMLFMGTVATYGRGEMIVTAIGMETALGQIATMLQTVKREPTPLQRRLAKLGRQLAVAALIIVAIVFVMGLLRDESPKLMFMTALSMAVAAVPEGLPAVATVALALGARRMLKRQALIRKLPAVETLGSVTVICSDKTGTLTENRMHVALLRTLDQRFEFGAEQESDPGGDVAATLMLACGALCNDASLEGDDDDEESLHATGDPTETALVFAAAKHGMPKADLNRDLPRVAEVPFDSDRKRMTTVHELPQGPSELSGPLSQALNDLPELSESKYITFTKGAVDSLLPLCTQVYREGQLQSLDDDTRRRVDELHDELAGEGMRVLAQGFRYGKGVTADGEAETLESNLVLLGLVALIDPPRREASVAVERCRAAGIRPVMITGDHPLTALNIAGQVGIASDGGSLTGRELSEMDETQFADAVQQVSVFARVAPEHKLRIVEALQAQGEVVSMTGDGVNDAPALKKASIGVAMGITGTDVAKEAGEMVLLDDNFATIVNAVEEGRTIYDNIRKFIKYTMTSNSGEIWVMLLAPFIGMPLPLLPLQILWVNLVTDGLPGLALAVEPTERNAMRRPPYPPDESMFSRGMVSHIFWVGLLMGVVSLGTGYWYWAADSENAPYWRTMVFTVLTFSQMGNVLAIRSDRDSLLRLGILSNKPLVASVLLTFLLQLIVIYLPVAQNVMRTTALSLVDFLIALALSSIVFHVLEILKLVWPKRELTT